MSKTHKGNTVLDKFRNKLLGGQAGAVGALTCFEDCIVAKNRGRLTTLNLFFCMALDFFLSLFSD